SVEAVTARAAACGVRVVDGEALLRDGVLEIDRGTVEVGDAHVVDDHLDAVELDRLVALEEALVEVELVDQARASAGLDGHAQTQVVAALLLEKALDLLRRSIRQRHAVRAGALFGQCGVAHVTPWKPAAPTAAHARFYRRTRASGPGAHRLFGPGRAPAIGSGCRGAGVHAREQQGLG